MNEKVLLKSMATCCMAVIGYQNSYLISFTIIRIWEKISSDEQMWDLSEHLGERRLEYPS